MRAASRLMLLNSVFRFGYGVGALLAPRAMAAARLVTDDEDSPEARLFVRAFGGHQLAVAAVGLAAVRREPLERPAALLAVAIDAFDISSALAEVADRRRVDVDLAGGLALSVAGLVTAAPALR